MEITKKLISFITAFSLCASMLCTPIARADDDETQPTPEASPEVTEAPGEDQGGDIGGTSGRKLYVDFMGRGDTPANVSPGNAALNLSDAQEQREFWVGVAVDKVHDLDLFTKGVYSVELAFEYDSTYLEPYSVKGINWNQAIIGGNLKDATNNEVWWNESLYEVVSVTDTAIDILNDREDLTNGKARAADPNWKMCTVCITMKNTGEDAPDMKNARFYGLESEEKQYLAKLPFKLKKAPDEKDENQNPTVLCLVRGPETLDIGAGTWGVDPYSAWEATVTDPDDQTNMKTLFTFNGDINLFGTSTSELDINDIIPVKPMSENETEDTEYKLSKSKSLLNEGFVQETREYYLSVPYETEMLKLKIAASAAPSVMTANGGALTASYDGNYNVTSSFTLQTVNLTEESDGFNNTVHIGDGSTTYTIHIRRLFKPKIVLNYGNSPVGMIMSDDETYPDKDAAIDDFKDTRQFNGVTPDLFYYTEAWESYKEFDTDEYGNKVDYDGDLDPTAIFIFQRTPFRDPGFTAYDALGNVVADTNITIELKMTAMSDGGFVTYDNEKDKAVDVIENQALGSGFLFDAFKNYDIRPDVYRMKYTFKDPVTGERINAERKVIAISQRGDVLINIYNVVNDNDAAEIITHANTDLSAGHGNSLYKFRIADALTNVYKVVNDNDAAEIITKATVGLDQFYNRLPEK